MIRFYRVLRVRRGSGDASWGSWRRGNLRRVSKSSAQRLDSGSCCAHLAAIEHLARGAQGEHVVGQPLELLHAPGAPADLAVYDAHRDGRLQLFYARRNALICHHPGGVGVRSRLGVSRRSIGSNTTCARGDGLSKMLVF